MILSSVSILVLDDNEHFTAIICTMLRAFGVERLFHTDTVAKASELLQSNEINLVLTELRVGRDSGLTLIDSVRTRQGHPNRGVPFIVVTAYSERRHLQSAIRFGADDVLVKPLSAAELYRRILRIVECPPAHIQVPGYLGPDRRRLNVGGYAGPERRAA